MHDHGTAELRGERELLGEGAPLLEPRRVVVVVVEAALADCSGAVEDELAQRGDVARGLKAGRIVRVYPGRVPEVAWITRGDCGGFTRGGENVVGPAAGADADYRPGPCETRPADYLVAVAGERRVGEVRVAVDVVWNAVVLRGHLRSIQRSTGLAT